MSAGHTPGPWAVEPRRYLVCVTHSQRGRGDGYNNRIAECHHWDSASGPQTSRAEAEANARLLAAAPELYEALVRLGTLAAAKYGARDDELWGAITQGIAACAKARGEA